MKQANNQRASKLEIIDQSGELEPNEVDDQSHVNMKQLGPLIQNNHPSPFNAVNNDEDNSEDDDYGSDVLDLEESVKQQTSVECDELEISTINMPFAKRARSNFIVLRLQQKSNQEMVLHSKINQQMPFQHIALKGKAEVSQFQTKEIKNKPLSEVESGSLMDKSSFQMTPSPLNINHISPQNVRYGNPTLNLL